MKNQIRVNPRFDPRKSANKGFSLIEILIYTAIIGVVGMLLNGILLALVRIQNNQVSSTEVNQQINFVIQNVQRLVRSSSAISMANNTPGNTLTLAMSDPNKNPTLIYLSESKAYLKEGSSSAVPLTTPDVNVTQLQFTKLSAYAGHDTVNLTIGVSYNSQNQQKMFSKTINYSTARIGP